MVKMKSSIEWRCWCTGMTVVMLMAAGSGIIGADAGNNGGGKIRALLINDELLRKLEEKMSASLIEWHSAPVSMVGEVREKIQYHSFCNSAVFTDENQSWVQSGWESNEGLVRLAMGVKLGRYGSLVTKVGFQHTLPGNYSNAGDDKVDGFSPLRNRHDKSENPVYIHEDMLAQLTILSKPAVVTLKFGGVQWNELSPLTVWEHQPRLFAWDYLPFEIDESVGAFYYKNIVSGERTDRVAWNRKPFNGIGLSGTELPHDFSIDFFYGSFDRWDLHEREFVDLKEDYSYYSDNLSIKTKGQGIGDPFRHTVLGRVQKKIDFRLSDGDGGDATFGLNVVRLMYDPDVRNSRTFRKAFEVVTKDSAFYKEPWIFSMDYKGTLTGRLKLFVEAAGSKVDTTFIVYKGEGLDSVESSLRADRPKFAAMVKIDNSYLLPLQLTLFAASYGFYSPFSDARSIDGCYPFGANLVGPGKFIASAYTQNMAGVNCSVIPWSSKSKGHVKITYGNHMQLRPGPDVIYFPYRLNGVDFFSLFQTSYSRWGTNLLDFSLDEKYQRRLGDESFRRGVNGAPLGPEAGGLRSDFLGIYESFVPYRDSLDAVLNLHQSKTSVFRRSEYIPLHRKYTFNGEIDVSRKIERPFGSKKSIYLSLYGAVNGISTEPKLFAVHRFWAEGILWGGLVRFEGAVELTERLYVLGLTGFENWFAEKAWMEVPGKQGVRRVPVDYRDIACGVGIDWQAFDRVGVHFRSKMMEHIDMRHRENNWKTPVMSLELKMWF